jgi:hypothetical protein
MKREDSNPIIAQATISKNQCIHQATLEKFISITNIENIENIFLYQARNNQAKNANDTIA